MEDYKYVYKDLTKMGYRRVRVSRLDHNRLVPMKLKWFQKAEYYVNDSKISVHFFINGLGTFLNVLLLPLMIAYIIVFEGVNGYKSGFKEIISLFLQKRTGSFIEEGYSRYGEVYDDLLTVMKG